MTFYVTMVVYRYMVFRGIRQISHPVVLLLLGLMFRMPQFFGGPKIKLCPVNHVARIFIPFRVLLGWKSRDSLILLMNYLRTVICLSWVGCNKKTCCMNWGDAKNIPQAESHTSSPNRTGVCYIVPLQHHYKKGCFTILWDLKEKCKTPRNHT